MNKYKTIPFKEKFVSIKDAATKAMSKVFKDRGFTNNNIIIEWNNIVGDEMAAKYKPAKITDYNKKITLYLDSVTLKDRQHIIYNQSIIIEKVNQFLGHKAIDLIKIESTLK